MTRYARSALLVPEEVLSARSLAKVEDSRTPFSCILLALALYVRADHWFDRDRAEKYYIRESCFKTGSDSVTVILWWEDEQQLIDVEEEEERRGSRRSDYRDEY